MIDNLHYSVDNSAIDCNGDNGGRGAEWAEWVGDIPVGHYMGPIQRMTPVYDVDDVGSNGNN